MSCSFPGVARFGLDLRVEIESNKHHWNNLYPLVLAGHSSNNSFKSSDRTKEETLSPFAAVPTAQERVGFWGRTHRLGLASAIVADALWGHCWPTDAFCSVLGVALDRSATVATCANVCDDFRLRLVTHEQPRMMLPAAFQSSWTLVGVQLRTFSTPPPAP